MKKALHNCLNEVWINADRPTSVRTSNGSKRLAFLPCCARLRAWRMYVTVAYNSDMKHATSRAFLPPHPHVRMSMVVGVEEQRIAFQAHRDPPALQRDLFALSCVRLAIHHVRAGKKVVHHAAWNEVDHAPIPAPFTAG